MERLGVFGGTFDPPHLAHLIIAEEARNSLFLDRIIFIPAGQAWSKENTCTSPAYHRLEMVRLSISTNPFFQVSTIEIERSGQTYTVDTIAALREEQREGTELFFLLGWDNLKELSRWKEPERLLQLCQLIAIPRPGVSIPRPHSLEKVIPGAARRIIFLDMTVIGISSSDIRRRLTQGLSIRYLVPETVDSYIQKNGLYRG